MYHLIPLFVIQVPTVSELSPPPCSFLNDLRDFFFLEKTFAGPCLDMPEQSGKNFEGELISNLPFSPLLISKITK